jgi:hypothetical protein
METVKSMTLGPDLDKSSDGAYGAVAETRNS